MSGSLLTTVSLLHNRKFTSSTLGDANSAQNTLDVSSSIFLLSLTYYQSDQSRHLRYQCHRRCDIIPCRYFDWYSLRFRSGVGSHFYWVQVTIFLLRYLLLLLFVFAFITSPKFNFKLYNKFYLNILSTLNFFYFYIQIFLFPYIFFSFLFNLINNINHSYSYFTSNNS